LSNPLHPWIDHPFGVARPIRHWLTDRGSLTRRLKARCADFRVVPLARGLRRPLPDERARLGTGFAERAYVREVLLRCQGEAVVFAHSVLARGGLRGAWNGITRLGSRPLGEALFANPRIRRESLSYRSIDRRHPLYRILQRHLDVDARRLWARRSLFTLDGRALLVTEVFLPRIASL
jgi:chorismate--pyruvate lyase